MKSWHVYRVKESRIVSGKLAAFIFMNVSVTAIDNLICYDFDTKKYLKAMSWIFVGV